MNHLMRGHAPITDEAWAEIDKEARERLVPALGARKLVDFDGPKGWKYSATNLGRTEEVADGPTTGTVASAVTAHRADPSADAHNEVIPWYRPTS